jgi:hypothetical protein
MGRLLIPFLALAVAGCGWTRPIAPPLQETATARVERLDREADAARRCQAAANREADRRRDRDARACPRN